MTHLIDLFRKMKFSTIPWELILLVITGITSFLLLSCSNAPRSVETVSEQFIIRDFTPVVNWHIDSAGNETRAVNCNKSLVLDYSNAITEGFIIPTQNQVREGRFEFSFSVKNTGKNPQKFLYKIFYQNESYKFPETDENDTTKQNINAWENFYGSWEDVSQTFKETGEILADHEFHLVSDHFRIVGNPRNEKRYYADGKNDRWKRNPRVGNYSFLLVVTSADNIGENKIPQGVQNISVVENGSFINPYFYFLHGEGRKLKNTIMQKSPYFLRMIAKPDPGAGIYIQNEIFDPAHATKYYCKTCGIDSNLYHKAPFEQFGHYIDPSTRMNNIPVIADVLKDNYSKMDYNWNRCFFTKEELIGTIPTVSKDPCKTVASDPAGHKIVIRNPGCEYGKWAKENVGVKSRHGFTYGKWTIKAKLTELLNRNNLWNGLTNAIWLITQGQADWNLRRDCNKEGYMANYYGGSNDKRVKNVGYSEIDFEILKTVPYCPSYLLPPAYNNWIDDPNHLGNWNVPLPEEILADDDKIEVCCTNWDMACWEPSDFKDGCQTISYNGQTFWAHRWDKTYRAITEKTTEPDDELFASPYYYFQIDWEPTEIIWRIGPSKDKLRVVGYVNQANTSIPNNQMLMIITQEFHNTRWWVGSAYQQDNIPFPKNDIVGEIYEMTIE
jgi:hypothetical protein